jgi:8-oxo-dGTP diphosphatase
VTAASEAAQLPRWTYVAAYALCRDGDGRVLLCRIGPGYDATGKWTLPGGGLEFGEDPAVGVLRELAEETGLHGEVASLALIHSGTGGPVVERERRYGPYHAIRIVYRARITGGELRDEADGSTDAARWFSLTEARDLPLVEMAKAAVGLLEDETRGT